MYIVYTMCTTSITTHRHIVLNVLCCLCVFAIHISQAQIDTHRQTECNNESFANDQSIFEPIQSCSRWWSFRIQYKTQAQSSFQNEEDYELNWSECVCVRKNLLELQLEQSGKCAVNDEYHSWLWFYHSMAGQIYINEATGGIFHSKLKMRSFRGNTWMPVVACFTISIPVDVRLNRNEKLSWPCCEYVNTCDIERIYSSGGFPMSLWRTWWCWLKITWAYDLITLQSSSIEMDLWFLDVFVDMSLDGDFNRDDILEHATEPKSAFQIVMTLVLCACIRTTTYMSSVCTIWFGMSGNIVRPMLGIHGTLVHLMSLQI